MGSTFIFSRNCNSVVDEYNCLWLSYGRSKSSSSRINCVHNGNNLLIDLQAIENHIVNFYKILLGSSFTPCVDEVCEVIQLMVTDSKNNLLSALPTDEEIKEAFSL